MTVTVPTATVTELLAANTDRGGDAHFIYIHNFSTTDVLKVVPQTLGVVVTVTAGYDYIVPKAASATQPGRLEIQNSGGDATLARAAWFAYQTSGGNMDVVCGRW